MHSISTLTNKLIGKSNNVYLSMGIPLLYVRIFWILWYKNKNIVYNFNCSFTNNIDVRLSDFKTSPCSAIVHFIKAMRESAPHDPIPLCLSKPISDSTASYYHNIIKTSFDNEYVDDVIKHVIIFPIIKIANIDKECVKH